MFLLKPLFLEQGADIGGLHNLIEWSQLRLQVTALQADHPIGQRIVLALRDVLAHNLHQVG